MTKIVRKIGDTMIPVNNDEAIAVLLIEIERLKKRVERLEKRA